MIEQMPPQFTEKARRAIDEALAIAEQVWRLSREFRDLDTTFSVLDDTPDLLDGRSPLAEESGLTDLHDVLSVLGAWIGDVLYGYPNDWGITTPKKLQERFGRKQGSSPHHKGLLHPLRRP